MKNINKQNLLLMILVVIILILVILLVVVRSSEDSIMNFENIEILDVNIEETCAYSLSGNSNLNECIEEFDKMPELEITNKILTVRVPTKCNVDLDFKKMYVKNSKIIIELIDNNIASQCFDGRTMLNLKLTRDVNLDAVQVFHFEKNV